MWKRLTLVALASIWFLAGLLLGYALALPEGNLFMGVLSCMAFIMGGTIYMTWG